MLPPENLRSFLPLNSGGLSLTLKSISETVGTEPIEVLKVLLIYGYKPVRH